MLTELVIHGAVIAGAAVWLIDRPRRARLKIARRQAILNAIESLQPDGTGFTITREASRQLGARVGPDHFYPLAEHLEDRGVLASRWGEATADRGWHRPRHYWFVGGKPEAL